MSAKIIPFPVQDAPAPVPARHPSKFYTPAEIRVMLKERGVNARMASVRCGSSLTYVTITIRMAAARAKVEALAKELNTWSMGMDDCVSGQSVHAELSEAAKEELRAPYMALASNLGEIPEGNSGRQLLPGVLLWNSDRGLYVSTCAPHYTRRPAVWTRDLLACHEWAVKTMALFIAEVVEIAAQEAAKVAA